MGKEILSPRLRDFLSKNQGEIHEPLSINQEDPPGWEGKQFQLREPSVSSSPYFFIDLIIGEAASPPSLDRPFLQVHITLLMLKSSDDRGNNNLVYYELSNSPGLAV